MKNILNRGRSGHKKTDEEAIASRKKLVVENGGAEREQSENIFRRSICMMITD